PFLAVFIVFLAASCISDVSWAKQPHYGGTLAMGLESSLPGFDPVDLGSLADRTAAQAFYDTLMRLDTQGRIEPNLLKNLTATDNGTTYIGTLRRGIEFHDGTPFNA